MGLGMGLVPTAPINTQYASPGMGQLGYDIKNVQDLGLLNKYILDSMWGMDRDNAALAKIFGMMSNQKTISFNANKFTWAVGDGEDVKTTLASTFTNGTSNYVNFTNQGYLPGYVARIAGTVTTTYGEVTIKLTSKYIAGSGYTYEQISYQDSASGTSLAFPTTSTVNLMGSTIEYHSSSPDGLTVYAKTLYNVMERIRESVVLGKRNNSAEMIYRNDIQKQLQLKWMSFVEKLNNTLYFSNSITDPTTTAGDIGRMGGFSYFLQPHVSAKDVQSVTDMGGTNIVFRGTTFDRQSVENYMIDLVNYGGKEKWVFASPDVIGKIWYGLMRDVNMTASTFSLPGTDKLWAGYNIELATATLKLIPDQSIRGLFKYVTTSKLCTSEYGYTGSTANTGTNNTNWALVVDPTVIDLAYLDNPLEGGVQSPKPYSVDLYGRKNVDQMEYDVTMSLVVKRPEACGFMQLKGS